MLNTWAGLLNLFVTKLIMSQELAALYKHHSLDGASENKVSCAWNATRCWVLFNIFWQFLLQPELYCPVFARESVLQVTCSMKHQTAFEIVLPNCLMTWVVFSFQSQVSAEPPPSSAILFVCPTMLCKSEDFLWTMTLSGLTFLWPCMCAIGLDNANLKHHVYCLISMTEYWYTTAKGRRFLKIQPTTICWN